MRLIIAEDDFLLAACICDTVEAAGHEVVCCEASAVRAFKLAKQDGGDLALVNISLNEGLTAGLGLAEQLKTELDIASIFVSGQRQDAVSAKRVALGYLPKPYRSQDLIAAILVAEVLQHGGKPPPPSIPSALELF